jgi:hypothetical protein
MTFEGARNIRVDRHGDLLLETGAGQVRQRKPKVYQEYNGRREEITARYVIKGKRQVGFAVGMYDHGKKLVIDPVIVYSTYGL